MNRYNSQKEIEKYRNLYLSYSRSQLITEMAQHKSSSDPHIAAKQLLDEIIKKDSDKKHLRILIIGVLTFLVALLSLLSIVFDLSWNNLLSLLRPYQSKQELNSHTTLEKKQTIKTVHESALNQPTKKELSQDKEKTK